MLHLWNSGFKVLGGATYFIVCWKLRTSWLEALQAFDILFLQARCLKVFARCIMSLTTVFMVLNFNQSSIVYEWLKNNLTVGNNIKFIPPHDTLKKSAMRFKGIESILFLKNGLKKICRKNYKNYKNHLRGMYSCSTLFSKYFGHYSPWKYKFVLR
jgi:hypothetical protein